MKVRLLRELLVNASDTQATARGAIVEMDAARARDLAGRPTPLVEVQTEEPAEPQAAEPVATKKASEPQNKRAPEPINKSKARGR